MRTQLMNCLKDETGGEVLEYALLVGLIVVGCIGLMSLLGVKVAQKWNEVLEAML